MQNKIVSEKSNLMWKVFWQVGNYKPIDKIQIFFVKMLLNIACIIMILCLMASPGRQNLLGYFSKSFPVAASEWWTIYKIIFMYK